MNNLYNNLLNMQVDESIVNNPNFQQLATELTANNPNNPPTNTTNTTNPPTDKTSNALINWSNDLINSEITERTEYNVDKDKVNEEIEDYRKRYLDPAANSVQDYVNRLREIRKAYDITDNVPQKEQDQRLSGLLMLANAFGNLASVTGEAAGDSAGGNRGLVPVRTNDKFDNLYNKYLANKDAAAQARALQIKRNMDDALEELKVRYGADKDYKDKEEREYQRLIDKYSNKKITKTGFNRVQKDPTTQEYKDYLEKKRLDKIRAYRSGGGRGKLYPLKNVSAGKPIFNKKGGGNPYGNDQLERDLYTGGDIFADINDYEVDIMTDNLRWFIAKENGIDIKDNEELNNYYDKLRDFSAQRKIREINRIVDKIRSGSYRYAPEAYANYYNALSEIYDSDKVYILDRAKNKWVIKNRK